MDSSYSLDLSLALERSKILQTPIDYSLFLALTSTDFSGSVQITFSTIKPSDSLFLDYSGTSISLFKLNSVDLPVSKTQNRISLGVLPQGTHSVYIEFSSSAYSTNGTGLHYFRDPADFNVYIYSYLFPYYANKVFPCFDQPDLKGTFAVTVKASSHLTVLSNEICESQIQENEEFSIWTFKKTPIMSTYILAFICGNYEGEQDIYARSSVNPFIHRDVVLNLLDIGKRTYNKLFGIEMQFSKCTQVFCPEFNMGAMENAGCVTINDSHIWKEDPVRSEFNWFQNVILHELCHMWFGNYVTMKWWDDLWLNESFATYLSYYITYTEIDPDIWIDFLVNKLRAYSSDCLESTHPVYMFVNTSEEAISNLDTITYWKGASLLKNLAFIIGQDAFISGLQRYFKAFGWKNVELKDFVDSMQSPFLANWVDEWVKTKGLNSLQIEVRNSSGKIESVLFEQSCVSGTCYRNHYILVEGFIGTSSVFQQKVQIKNQKSGEIEELRGFDAVDGIVFNAEDHGYVQIVLDEQSVEYFFTQGHVKDMNSTNRGVLWQSLWNRVENSQMKNSEFINFVSNLLFFEDLEPVIDIISNFAMTILSDFTPSAYLPEYSHKLFEAITNKLHLKSSNKCLERKIFTIATTREDIFKAFEYSKTLARGETWKGIMLLSTISTKSEIKEILKEELKYDRNDVSIFLKLYCKSARVDNKSKAWEECVNHRKYSLIQASYLMSGFWQTKDLEYLKGYFEKYFDVVPWVVETHEREYAENFLRYLLPRTENPDDLITALENLNLSKRWAQRFVEESIESLKKTKIHLQNFI